MNVRKHYLNPTILFASGLTLIIAIDFGIRIVRNVEYSLGLSEPIWFLLQLIALAIASSNDWKSTSTETLNSRLITPYRCWHCFSFYTY